MLHFSVRRSLPVIGFSLLLVLFLSVGAPVHAGGTVLDCDNDTAFSSLLVGGGLVTFNCGNAHLEATIALSSTKTISDNTVIDGGGKITLSGGHSLRLFTVSSGVTLRLKNIVLANGYGSSSDGGTIYNAGHLILDTVIIQGAGNSNFYGAAVATTGAVDVANSKFLNNNAGSGGAIYAIGSNAIVSISESILQDNSVSSTNPNSKRGGAIYLANGAKVTLSETQVLSNTGAYGGGIANENGTLTLSNMTLAYNNSSSTGAGGGIYNLGTADLTNVTFFQNSIRTGNGGGMYNKGTATMSHVTFSQNSSSYGGGIANDHGTLTVTDSMFSENSANVAGGGGIASGFGTLTLTNSTLTGNFASGDAGGVENGKGTATLTNVTLSGNYASSGGGMWNLFGGVATLNNVTFYGNTASSSAGGLGNSNDANSHLYLTNVIIADSKTQSNCDFQKAPDTSDHNLSTDASCNFGAGRDSVKIKLGPLETNGGLTQTHRLLPGSIAIDNGVFVNSILTDQRGLNYTRPKGAAFDVGAVEFAQCDTPSKPERWFPMNGAQLTTPQVTLDWIGPDCAKNFSVTVRRGSKTGPIVFSKNKIKATQVTTTALAKNQKYFWQVTAYKGVQSTTSSWGKFTVK